MMHNAAGRRQRQRLNGNQEEQRCNNPSCVSLRQRFGPLCASLACTARERDALETRNRLLEVRLGRGGEMPGNVPRAESNGTPSQQRESLHMLSERLKALGALITEWQRAQTNAPRLQALEALANELGQKMQAKLDDGEEWDEALGQQTDAVEKLVREARVELQPYVCGMCLDPLVQGKAVLGKNCYHYYCIECVSENALRAVQPIIEKHDDPYWEYVRGVPAADPINDSDRHEYRLRPEAKGTFPADYWMRCPECNEPHYCNKAYYDMVMEVLRNPVADAAAEEEERESPSAVVEKLRNEDRAFLLDAPGPVPEGERPKVMLVPAKVPRTAQDPITDNQRKFNDLCNALGFRFGPVGDDGGKAHNREKEFDDVVDTLIAGATLRKTLPVKKRVWVDAFDAEGQPIKKQGTAETTGGTYKIDLPRPDPIALDAPGADDEEDQLVA